MITLSTSTIKSVSEYYGTTDPTGLTSSDNILSRLVHALEENGVTEPSMAEILGICGLRTTLWLFGFSDYNEKIGRQFAVSLSEYMPEELKSPELLQATDAAKRYVKDLISELELAEAYLKVKNLSSLKHWVTRYLGDALTYVAFHPYPHHKDYKVYYNHDVYSLLKSHVGIAPIGEVKEYYEQYGKKGFLVKPDSLCASLAFRDARLAISQSGLSSQTLADFQSYAEATFLQLVS